MIDHARPFYHDWQFWLQMVQLVGIVVIGVYTWWTNREKVTAKRFESLEKDVAGRVTVAALEKLDIKRDARCALHLERTAKLELMVTQNRSDINNLPGHANVNKIHARVDAVQKELSTMNGRLEGIARTVELINEYLIKEGKK